MRFKPLQVFYVLLITAQLSTAQAQNYPDIQWKTMETPHFIIHYSDSVAWTASKVAKTAEEIYPQITGIYHHEPKRKTHVILRDDQDRSNGFAVFNLGWVTLWTAPSSLVLRGRHDWLRGVFAHEFSHIVSLQASSPAGWLMEGIRFGGVSGNADNRNVDAGATVVVPTHPYPRWWAEGTAQLDSYKLGLDTWDTQRDMVLRAATLENNLLTFDEMRNIEVRENFGGEMVYNQGFAFLLWLTEKYGADANVKVTKNAYQHWYPDFDQNFSDVFGKDAKTLYNEWKRYLVEKYSKVPPLTEGERIPLLLTKALNKLDPKERPYKDGTTNSDVRFSPDGRWLSWVSRGVVKLRQLDVPYMLPNLEMETKEKPVTLDFPGGFYSWAPDSKKIVVSRRKTDVFGGYPYYDLFTVDLSKISAKNRNAKPHWMTKGLRATHVAWSPDGKSIAFSQNKDGGRNLRLIDADGKNPRDLVALGGDSEATSPVWSPDGKSIAFTFFHHGQADIWQVPALGGEPKPITLDSYDDRDPWFSPDGKTIFYSSNRSGIFQIFQITGDLKPVQLTQVSTGAFQPYVAPNNKDLFYMRYSSFGFKPYRLNMINHKSLDAPLTKSVSADNAAPYQLTPESFPSISGKKYFFSPRPVRLFPSLIFENEQFKLGAIGQFSDYLEKHNFTALGLFGKDQDYQVSYENKMFYPTLTASYTAYIRNNSFKLVDNKDGINNEAEEIIRDNIQFIQAGVSQNLTFDEGFSGDHSLSLTYNKRFVDRRLGAPVFIGNNLDTEFRLLTNDGVTAAWSYVHAPSTPKRDADINPRNLTQASATYSWVRTHLASPDTTIPGPNQKYIYHEGTFNFSQYLPLPFSHPWWNQHTLWARFNGGYKSRNVNINDEFFLGGRLNFRAFGQISNNTLFYGYNDFSIAGETLVLLSTGYTFPIIREIDMKKGWFYFDSVYGVIFAETGNAWTHGKFENTRQGKTGTLLLTDVGAEIRIKTFLFNEGNSWNSIIRAAYGFQDDAAHGFSNTDSPVRFFLGVGTNF